MSDALQKASEDAATALAAEAARRRDAECRAAELSVLLEDARTAKAAADAEVRARQCRTLEHMEPVKSIPMLSCAMRVFRCITAVV